MRTRSKTARRHYPVLTIRFITFFSLCSKQTNKLWNSGKQASSGFKSDWRLHIFTVPSWVGCFSVSLSHQYCHRCRPCPGVPCMLPAVSWKLLRWQVRITNAYISSLDHSRVTSLVSATAKITHSIKWCFFQLFFFIFKADVSIS